MKFLAVDPGSKHLGWAIFDMELERPIEWGEIDLEKVPYERRFMEIHRHLYQITHKHEPEIEGIAVEDAVKWRGKKIPELEVAVRTVYNFGHVRFRGPARNYRSRKYNVATWKASITGSAQAKDEMIDRTVRLHFPDLPEGLGPHVMDAIGIGLHHLSVRKIEDLALAQNIRGGGDIMRLNDEQRLQVEYIRGELAGARKVIDYFFYEAGIVGLLGCSTMEECKDKLPNWQSKLSEWGLE